MTGGYRLLLVSAATIGLMSGVSAHAIAQVQPTARSIGNNESVFIDRNALTITQATAKDDVSPQIAKLDAHEIGSSMIIFRANDKLYIVDAPPLPLYALNDDRQRSYGGLNDDRQRSYGGLYDRQQSYGGLNDDRQRSYGGMYDRQQSYGGLNDDRQRSYGGMYDRQQSYGGLNDDRQRS